jgi:hypothetical protein
LEARIDVFGRLGRSGETKAPAVATLEPAPPIASAAATGVGPRGSRVSFAGTAALSAYLLVYVALGLFGELSYAATKPIPGSMFEDFGFFLRALADASSGRDPYGIRNIGPAFLYPPPALLLVWPFAQIPDQLLRAAAFLSLNLGLLAAVVWGIARRYGYSFERVWWWFPLAFGFAPVLETLHLGQMNLVAAFGSFLLIGFEATGSWLAGFGLALAVLIKVTPLFLVAYVAAIRSATIFHRFVICAGVGLLAVAIAFGPAHLFTYIDVFFGQAGLVLPGDGSAQGLLSVLSYYHLFDVLTAQRIAGTANLVHLAPLVVSALVGFLYRQTRQVFLVASLLAVVTPTLVWYHQWSLLLVPALVWIASTRFQPVVVLWWLVGLMAIQLDQFGLTRGLISQGFAHVSLGIVLVWQAISAWRSARDPRVSVDVARTILALRRVAESLSSEAILDGATRTPAGVRDGAIPSGEDKAVPSAERPVPLPSQGAWLGGLGLLGLGLVVGFAVRLWIILHGLEVADVEHLHNVGRYLLIEGKNPYSLPPFESNFPPVALFLEAGAILVSNATQIPFHIIFKLWPLASDLGCAVVIFVLLVRDGRGPRRAALWTWLYLLNPVSIIITADHGNLDPVTNFLAVLALALLTVRPGRWFGWSALSLGLAVAVKPNSILLMPFFAAARGLRFRQRVLYAIVTGLPTGLTLIPFFLNDAKGVIGNLAGYAGEYDFGFAAPLRAAWYMKATSFWLPGTVGLDLTSATRFTFLAAYAALWLLAAGRARPAQLAMVVYVLFYTLFAGLSAQYSVWVLPFAILAGDWFVILYSIAATCGLVGFYLVFWPDILLGQFNPYHNAPNPGFVPLYFWGTLAQWGASALWLVKAVADLFRPTEIGALRIRDGVVTFARAFRGTMDWVRIDLAVVAMIAFLAALVPVAHSLQSMFRALGS